MDLSARIVKASGDQRTGSYFRKRKRLIIQKGNVTSLLGTTPQGAALDKMFYLELNESKVENFNYLFLSRVLTYLVYNFMSKIQLYE